MSRSGGWRWFLGWSLVGALGTFTILGALSFGMFALPFAIAAFVAVRNRSRGWPEALGIGFGVGFLLLLIAFENRHYTPCPANGFVTLAPGQTGSECGGFPPIPWLVAGLVLTASGVVGYGAARRRVEQVPSRARVTAEVESGSRPRAWIWLLLGLWLVVGVFPVATVNARLVEPLHPQHGLSVDHSISLLFGGGGSLGQTGDVLFTPAQRHAMLDAWRLHSLDAQALALFSAVAFVVVLVWRRRVNIALASGSFLFAVALVILAGDLEGHVKALRVPLGGRLHLHYEIWYWLFFVTAIAVAVSCGIHAWATIQRTSEHESRLLV